MANLRHFVRDLILLCKKASQIARLIRKDDQLLQLLTQEKPIDVEQGHFTQDFKTLADVLIQEMVKDFLQKSYPLLGVVLGEESNQFTNNKGKIVEIKIKDTMEQTVRLLAPLMNESEIAASKLATVIWSQPQLTEEEENELNQLNNFTIDESQLGIWIDPIDSTNEFVKLEESGLKVEPQFATNGLATVTCLLGIFSLKTGEPWIGVMSLPFHSTEGLLFWGVDLPNQLSCTNLPSVEPSAYQKSKDQIKPLRLLVGSDRASQEFVQHLKFEKNQLEVFQVSGAGYKLYLICSGQADGWICASRNTVYKWDTCAGHALLRARFSDSSTANVVEFTNVLDQEKNKTRSPLRYTLDSGGSQECHQTGLIAFSDPCFLHTICMCQSNIL